MLKKARDTGFFNVMCSADGVTTNAERCGQDFGYTLTERFEISLSDILVIEVL